MIGCRSILLLLLATAVPAAGHAAVEVTRGPQTDMYGSCMPTLSVANDSAGTIDYLQVDLVIRFRNGREATAELKSAYRHGIRRPIAPGASATLKINPDETSLLGGSCADILSVTAVGAVCESAAGDCSPTVRTEALGR